MRMRRTFEHKFLLSEQELRRICGALDQQFEKKNCGILRNFNVEYKNGAEEEIHSLDKVLELTNDGAWSICNLSLAMRSDNRDTRVSLDFDASAGVTGNSITLLIEDEDRDWVHITSSLIEDRINKIKRLHLAVFSMPVSPIFFILGASVSITTLFTGAKASPGPILLQLAIGFILLFTGFALSDFFLIPAQVFYWGDMVGRFNRARAVRNFLLVGIILTLILGIIGGIISNYIFKWLT